VNQPGLPDEGANPIFKDLFGARVPTIPPTTEPATTSTAESATSAVPESAVVAKPLRRFIGVLGAVMPDRRRKLYTSASLDGGVEIPQDAIILQRRLPASLEDGLERDVVWVDADADIFHFTRRPRWSRDPDGGSSWPTSENVIRP
jgi:hypothetical protein